jgi:hypothetical protein
MTSPVIRDEPAPTVAARPAGVHWRLGRATAYLILCGFTLSPLLWVSIPPLVDYPNHLARMWILLQGGKIPELANNYVVHWRLVPNLALDLVVPTLARIMPLEVAGRVFIALTMLGLVAGTTALHRALLGKVGLWPLASLLFIYNAALYWGFLNFLFGIGLYLLAFSGWIASGHWPLVRRLAVFSIVAALIFILHLFAFGLYGLSVSAYELEIRLRERRSTVAALRSWIITCLHFVPALVLGLVGSNGPNLTVFGGLGNKLYALMAPANFVAEGAILDYVMVCCVYLALICLIRSRSLTLAPGMQLPLIALGLATLLMPNWLNGSWLADIRLPVALPFIVIAATQIDVDRKWATALASVALVLLAARVWSVTLTWRDYDGRVAEFRAAAGVIEPGNRLLVVKAPTPESYGAVPAMPMAFGRRTEASYWHVPALAVIDRSAFIPYLFTGLTTIVPAQRNVGLFTATGGPLKLPDLARGKTANPATMVTDPPDVVPRVPYWDNWPANFDYVVSIEAGPPSLTELGILDPVAVGSFFGIYRVARP